MIGSGSPILLYIHIYIIGSGSPVLSELALEQLQVPQYNLSPFKAERDQGSRANYIISSVICHKNLCTVNHEFYSVMPIPSLW